MASMKEEKKKYQFVVDEKYDNEALEKIPTTAILDGFGQNTSAHGISHFTKAKGGIKKLFWGFFTLCSVSALIYYGETLCVKFFSWPVAVLVNVEHVPELTFPAITVCNMNPVRGSAIAEDAYLSSLLGLTTTESDDSSTDTASHSESGMTNSTQSVTSAPAAVGPAATQAPGSAATQAPVSAAETTVASPSPSSGSGRGRRRRKKRATVEQKEGPTNSNGKSRNARFDLGLQFRQYIAEQEVEYKMAMGHQMDDFILSCEYEGYDCEMSDVYTFYNSKYGNCFIFNSGWNFTNSTSELELSKRPGPEYGLSMIFNVDQDEYVGDFADSAGVRVVVHSQDSMPFPEDEGIVVAPGQSTSVGITKEEIIRQSSPYGDCINMEEIAGNIYSTNVYQELYPVNYTTRACLKTCIQKYMMSECNCADSAYPTTGEAFTGFTNISICDFTDSVQSDCSKEVLTKYKDGELVCDCSTSCNEGVFVTLVSSSLWPSNAYRQGLFEDLMANDKAARVIMDEEDPDKYKENFVKLTMYFEEFNLKTIEETPAYQPGQFVSDIGGILGLFIGFSLLTILEFVELLFDLLVLCCYKLHLGKNKTESSSDGSTTDSSTGHFAIGNHRNSMQSQYPPPPYSRVTRDSNRKAERLPVKNKGLFEKPIILQNLEP